MPAHAGAFASRHHGGRSKRLSELDYSSSSTDSSGRFASSRRGVDISPISNSKRALGGKLLESNSGDAIFRIDEGRETVGSHGSFLPLFSGLAKGKERGRSSKHKKSTTRSPSPYPK